MELNFPSPATTGTVYTGTNSVTYIYDGLKWQGQIPVQSDLDTGLIHYYDDQLQARPTGDVVIATDSGNWAFGADGNLTLPLTTKLNSGGVGVTNSAEFGTDVTVDGSNIITSSEIYMGAGTAEARLIVDNSGNSLMYSGVENTTLPGFAGIVAIDPNVTSQYAVKLDVSNNITIGATQGGTLSTTEYTAAIGVLNTSYNITGMLVTSDKLVLSNTDQNWNFGADGNLTLPGNLISNNQSIKFISTTTDHTSYTVTDNTIKFGNISNSTVTWDIVTNNNSTGFTNTRLVVPTSTANTNTYVSFSSPSNTTVLQNSELINQMPGGKPGFSVISSDKISLVTGINAVAGTGSAGGLNGMIGWTWTFGSDGRLTLPEGGSIADTTSSLVISASNGSVPGYPSTPGSSSWYFGVDGSLTFPDATKQTTAWTGTVSYSNVADIPTFTTSTLYKGTATLTLGSTGIVTLFRGSTIQDTIAHAIAFGLNAGGAPQGSAAVALGYGAGYQTQGTNSIAIGESAGRTTQGNYAIAIGYEAGKTSQHANSTVINATGATLNTTATNAFYVKPVRSVSTTTGLRQVWYDPTTGEFVYYTP